MVSAGLLIMGTFWFALRYPQLFAKAEHVGQVLPSMAYSSEVIPVAPDAPVWRRILFGAVNWLYSMKIGMTFGMLLGALLLHTVLRYYPLKIGRNLYLNSLKGALVGAPIGVCGTERRVWKEHLDVGQADNHHHADCQSHFRRDADPHSLERTPIAIHTVAAGVHRRCFRVHAHSHRIGCHVRSRTPPARGSWGLRDAVPHDARNVQHHPGHLHVARDLEALIRPPVRFLRGCRLSHGTAVLMAGCVA